MRDACSAASVAGGPAVADEEFLDLICSDEEWLRAEFDAIIAAGWGAPRPPTPQRWASPAPATPRRSSRTDAAADLSVQGFYPGNGSRVRQRSPPRDQ